MKLSVTVPTYNASEFVEGMYADVKSQIASLGIDYEFLFRDDCSSDDTREKLKKIAEGDKKVRLFFNSRNMGLGYNIARLFKDAKGNAVVYLDADLSFDVKRLRDFLKEIEAGRADACIASKYAGVEGSIPLVRRVPSRLYYLMNRLLFGVKVKDIGSGFVVIRKKCLQGIDLKAKRFAVHVELFDKLSRKGCILKEIPVKYVHEEGGSFKLLKHGPKTLLDTFNYWMVGRNG